MAVSTYLITKNLVGKKVGITVGDQMTPAEAMKFEQEFKALLNSINASEFELEINGTNMNVLTPDMASRLQGVMGIYQQAGFKKVLIKTQNNPVLKMQINRVARQAGLTNMEIIH